MKQWINTDETMALSLNFFASVPDIPTLKNIDALRDFYRQQIAAANGGIIQVDLRTIEGLPSIKTIFKIPQGAQGVTYLTSITLPFKDCSYVIKIQAPELDTTGMRESLVADILLKEGIIKLNGTGFIGWVQDPYLEEFTDGSPMNLSDRGDYDLYFPTHALTVSRGLIREIETQMELNETIKKVQPFTR